MGGAPAGFPVVAGRAKGTSPSVLLKHSLGQQPKNNLERNFAHGDACGQRAIFVRGGPLPLVAAQPAADAAEWRRPRRSGCERQPPVEAYFPMPIDAPS